MRWLRFGLTVLLPIVFAGTAKGQVRNWGVTTELGLSAYSGSAWDSTRPGTVGHPSRASSLGLRLDANRGKLRIAIGLLYASTGVEISDNGLQVVERSAFKLVEVAPELGLRLISLSSGGVVRVHGGVVIDHWEPSGGETRTLLGGMGAVSLELPIAARLMATARWESSMTKSVFREAEVPPNFALRRSLRNRIGLGIRLAL